MPPEDSSKPPNKEELEEIFEKTLRPLQSRNARHIFLILRDSEHEYLTTYDMQPILDEQGIKLTKVELNNWLSALQDVGLVRKAEERGKPTTMPYTKRYTFDLWKLTQKGRETSFQLDIFRGNTPIQVREKVVEKTIEKNIEITKLPELGETNFGDLDKLQTLSTHLAIIITLYGKESIDLWGLSESTGITSEKIVEFIENQGKIDAITLYLLEEIPMDLKGKIMQTIGLSPRKNYTISLSPEGKKMAEILSP
ncbi:MAG: hypothetical protein NWE89_05795 [Candidatus Bathyarchaeota archaeon]|nr:hypothetical protein [Candidatus Bathyarchaeota archaeon]